ncbi:hypothetical protein ACFLXF_04785 [Chloroflexota bacterium]
MNKKLLPGFWQAKRIGKRWQVVDEGGGRVAAIENAPDEGEKARLVAASPYMLQALQAVSNIIGEEDLPDNGEFSGAAISDMVRTAIKMATDS